MTPVANLTSFIKDYSNIWLKTDLITYLRGRLEKNTPAFVQELTEKKAEILKKIPEITPADLVKDKLFQAVLKLALGEKGGSLVTAADTVITTMINELVGPKTDPAKRPKLFELNPKLLGARHDTHLSQKQADSIARKLGYVSGRLHLIEIRANQEEAILAGSTRTKIPSDSRLTTKHSRALTDITDTVNEYLDQQRSLLGTHPFTIQGEVEFNERIKEIYTDIKKDVDSGNQEAVKIITIARERIDRLIDEVQ